MEISKHLQHSAFFLEQSHLTGSSLKCENNVGDAWLCYCEKKWWPSLEAVKSLCFAKFSGAVTDKILGGLQIFTSATTNCLAPNSISLTASCIAGIGIVIWSKTNILLDYLVSDEEAVLLYLARYMYSRPFLMVRLDMAKVPSTLRLELAVLTPETTLQQRVSSELHHYYTRKKLVDTVCRLFESWARSSSKITPVSGHLIG